MGDEIIKGGEQYICRYRPNNEFTLDEIENSYIFFSNRNSLNDPFDSSPNLIRFISSDKEKYSDFVRNIITNQKDKEKFDSKFTPEILIKETIESIPEYINKIGIACFSTHPINMILWANYSNNHKGVCLQFDTNCDDYFFEKIRYMKYSEKLETNNFDPLNDEFEITDIFFKKDINWSKEEEIRLLNIETGKVHFEKKSLKNIICGYKSDNIFVNKIIEIVKGRNIGVYKMLQPEIHNKIPIEKIN
jgi:hypothetical protein